MFRNNLYKEAYSAYKSLIPSFSSLHESNKPACMASVENEISCNVFAFQGTMKVLNMSGREIKHIQGCGHHGLDWVGMASVGVQVHGCSVSAVHDLIFCCNG